MVQPQKKASLRIYEGEYKPGTILSGCPSGGGDTTYGMQIVNLTSNAYTILARDCGDGATLNLSKFNTGYTEVYINSGVTVSNLVFKPMIKYAEIADSTYVPYKETTATVLLDEPLRGLPVTDKTLANYIASDGTMWCCDELDFNSKVRVNRVYEYTVTGEEKFYSTVEGRTHFNIPIASIHSGKFKTLITSFPFKTYGNIGEGKQGMCAHNTIVD